MEKNKTYEVYIIDMGMNFEGIAKHEGKVIFVPGAIVSEVVKIKIIKDTKNYAIGKIEEIIKKSEYRIEDECNYSKRCGGCDCRHIEYNYTLDIKKNIVINTLEKQEIDISKVGDIYGMGVPYHYRNKVQYPVRNVNGKSIMGMFSKRSHDIIEVKECMLQDARLDKFAQIMFKLAIENGLEGYNENTKVGDIKNIMVRVSKHFDEVLCIFVTNGERLVKDKRVKNVVEKLSKYNEVKGIVLNINKADNNVILSDQNFVAYGKDFIQDKIENYIFNISTESFFQVNTIGAEILYNVLKNSLMLDKKETLLELYSGVGTIGMFLSSDVKNVYGVEIVEDAVKMARENAKLNDIGNVTYILGDAKVELEKLKEKGMYFNTIVVDPPRRGLDFEAMETIIQMKPEKIGYVSCNVSTLARDLALLKEHYNIKSINLVDMFPWTGHVETVVVLKRR